MTQSAEMMGDNAPMSDSQIHVPDSFLALFRVSGSSRLAQPETFIRSRYETCEDMAQLLAPQLRGLAADLGVDAGDVAGRMGASLQDPGVGLAAEEAQWVATRVTELMRNGS